MADMGRLQEIGGDFGYFRGVTSSKKKKRTSSVKKIFCRMDHQSVLMISQNLP